MAKEYFKVKSQIFELDKETYTMKAVTSGSNFMAISTSTMHEYEFGISLLTFQTGVLKTLAAQSGEQTSSTPGVPEMEAFTSTEEEFLAKKAEVTQTMLNNF